MKASNHSASASASIRTTTSSSCPFGHDRKPKAPRTAGVAFSHAEFDALPHSVQRKYFSSLERLRIQEQQSLDDQLHHQQWLTYPYPYLQPHPDDVCRRSSHSRSHSIGLHRRSLSLISSRRRRLRKAESLRIQQEQEAQFFLSLPPKLRKQHFSQEEQLTLLGRIQQHPPLPDAALRDRERARQRFTDFRFDFYGDQDGADPSTKQRERGRSRRRSRSLSPNRVAVSDDVQDIPTAEKDQPSAEHTTTTNTTTTMSPPLSFQRTRTSPPKFRRTLSLTNIPLRHSTSSAPPPLMDPPLQFFTPQQRHQRSTSLSQTGRRSSHTPHAPVFDPEATHYQDPEARKKLRTYLASPQKFDEAVEFGFPSAGATAEVGGDGAVAATTTTTASRYQLPPIRTDARGFSRDMQTFLREDRVSFLEDNDDDDDDEDVEGEGEVDLETDAESITDVESPVTPSSAANMSMSTSTSTSTSTSFRNGGRGHARHISPSTFSSLDSSSGMRGVQPPRGGGGGLALNREMTLRMTLTRPDLRADEEQLYGWQTQAQQKDPFALEELHLSDDMTGGKSPFAVKGRGQGGLVARLRLLRRRG